jgi:hypothetical protein
VGERHTRTYLLSSEKRPRGTHSRLVGRLVAQVEAAVLRLLGAVTAAIARLGVDGHHKAILVLEACGSRGELVGVELERVNGLLGTLICRTVLGGAACHAHIVV